MASTDPQVAIDAIDAAIAGGSIIESMTFGDQSFTFRSMDDMLRARAHFVSLLGTASGSSGTRYAATSKGCGGGTGGDSWR